jgi:hypothetical protein
MRIGIVGSEASKFTPETEILARHAILSRIRKDGGDVIISGECHLGGVDIYAKEIAQHWGLGYIGYPPKHHSWTYGYRPRNVKIAKESDKVVCITIKDYPATYDGMKFIRLIDGKETPYCYHCDSYSHVKSGGCWTMHYAHKLGKNIELIII